MPNFDHRDQKLLVLDFVDNSINVSDLNSGEVSFAFEFFAAIWTRLIGQGFYLSEDCRLNIWSKLAKLTQS